MSQIRSAQFSKAGPNVTFGYHLRGSKCNAIHALKENQVKLKNNELHDYTFPHRIAIICIYFSPVAVAVIGMVWVCTFSCANWTITIFFITNNHKNHFNFFSDLAIVSVWCLPSTQQLMNNVIMWIVNARWFSQLAKSFSHGLQQCMNSQWSTQ